MREHHTKIAMRLKEILKEEMHGKLICLKVDSAARHNRHILGINVQYAVGDKVVIRSLGMIQVKESQTAAFLKSKVMETLAEYGLSVEQIFSVTCDNGANMLATVRKLKHELELTLFEKTDGDDGEEGQSAEESKRDISEELCIEFQERINLVRCAVHTLQLAILDVVNKSNESVKSLTDVAKKCKNVKYRTFFEFHTASYPPVWSQTRWGGMFKMVESFKDQKVFFTTLADQFPELDLSSLWTFVDHYYDAFKPLYICTKKMQESHVSLSDFYMAWLMATSEVQKVTDNPFVPALIQSLRTRLDALRHSRAFKMGLFLDPRFNYHASKLFTGDEKEEIQRYITETWERIRQLEPTSTNMNNESLSGSTDEFDQYLTKMFGGSMDTSIQENATNFLQQVKSLDLEPRQNHNYNVWNHWLRRKTTHPELHAVAMIVLSTPSNQVSVERSFSALGLVLSNLRTGLAEETLANILMIKLNKNLFQKTIQSVYNWKEYVEISGDETSMVV
ncbi:uncharacterized protein LOC135711433 [Ochlerotatus camptorhynchus]|uniref:uncharacterized protein LOC135711433 n=1 Tax=Ochlerotatus camptorhynchus TaxID=644619 RepID=UPI0031DD2111